MATTVLGDDSVPKTKFQALAGELRLLKSGMADMQGRLDALLIEIGTELEQVRNDSEPTGEVLPDRQDVEDTVVVEVAPASAGSPEVAAEAITITEVAAVADEPVTEINPEQVAAAEVAPIETDPIDTIEVIEATVSPDVEIIEPTTAVAEVTTAETAEAVVLAEPVAETAQTAPTATADAVAEPATATPDNVVVLADRRAESRKGRGVVARTARWAAAIVLIVMAAAIAATGTGFAGNGEFLTIKDVCAIASDVCSIVPGIP